MKCPYPECHKDYNDDSWNKIFEGFLNAHTSGEVIASSIAEREFFNRLFVISRRCRFCHQLFHEVYVGKEKWNGEEIVKKDMILLVSYPVSKTKFESKGIPRNIIDHYNEAERCMSVGSLTGAGACLRKTIYALCDDKKAQGKDRREQIENLPVKGEYKELLKQVKWLGDNMTKPDTITYKKEQVDLALEVLPLVIDELYAKDEKIEKVARILAKQRSDVFDPTKE